MIVNYDTSAASTGESGGNSGMWIGLLLLAAAVVGIYFYTKKKEEKNEEQAEEKGK